MIKFYLTSFASTEHFPGLHGETVIIELAYNESGPWTTVDKLMVAGGVLTSFNINIFDFPVMAQALLQTKQKIASHLLNIVKCELTSWLRLARLLAEVR